MHSITCYLIRYHSMSMIIHQHEKFEYTDLYQKFKSIERIQLWKTYHSVLNNHLSESSVKCTSNYMFAVNEN